jgi:hypothetical protein
MLTDFLKTIADITEDDLFAISGEPLTSDEKVMMAMLKQPESLFIQIWFHQVIGQHFNLSDGRWGGRCDLSIAVSRVVCQLNSMDGDKASDVLELQARLYDAISLSIHREILVFGKPIRQARVRSLDSLYVAR